ncbi:MAG: hypothetical protein JXB30_08705 [Anaerolineae bacterium]|nr:hypothetical protein [Anaerolineae bacterium]
MKIDSRVLMQGLLLPIRVYLQPLTVLREAAAPSTPDHPVPSMGLVYAFSLLWLPIGIGTGLIIFGFPRENVFTLLVVIPGLLVLMGMFMGRAPMQIRQGGQVIKQVFNYPLPVGFGIVFGLTALFHVFMLEMLSRQHGIDIAEVVDSRTLDVPAAIILGAGGALSLNLGLGSTLGPRKLALFGTLLPLIALAVGVFSFGAQPDSLAAFIPTFLLIGHLGLQPLYFLIGLASLLLAGISPDRSPVLWQLSPACWCEYSYVPLPGLAWLLYTVYRADPDAGSQAVSHVMSHPFYHRTAERVARKLDPTRSDRGISLPGQD